jgi:molecular chaperone DnaK (HSP70)
MRLGIDFGTTRTVVAAVDRGNYPVVSFDTGGDGEQPWYPSLLAVRGDQVEAGWSAAALRFTDGWTVVRSLKRLLVDAGPETVLEVGGRRWHVIHLLGRYLDCLRRDLLLDSNLGADEDETLEAMIAVPANAASGQRFVTLEAFRQAGFEVLGMINEPSAAGIEYGHRHTTKSGKRRKEHLLVYDFGGGTFDASVIRIAGRHHEILANEGVPRLGGDDFDEQLLRLVLEEARQPEPEELTPGQRLLLLEECRERKEGLHPNTRKVMVELEPALPGAGEVTVEVEALEERCAPLVERTVEAVERAVARGEEAGGTSWDQLAGVYLVGGASDLPLVGRRLRELWGHRVRRSPHARFATAIGLAITADGATDYTLRERFGRHFGVWREARDGREVAFDAIFPKGAPLPAADEPTLVFKRRYRPVHTIGHFRYLECTDLDDHGQPRGGLTPWTEIHFPFDPRLRDVEDLESLAIEPLDLSDELMIEEQYACDARGVLEVTLSNTTHGYRRTYRLR